MTSDDQHLIEESQQGEPRTYGRDEMNLAEFPFASLRRMRDTRKALSYTGWITDRDGVRHQQQWEVRGLEGIGLPTEFDERVYVALMYLTAQANFESRKVPFSVYGVLQIMGQSANSKHYRIIENSLHRLKGVTIKTEGAFWDQHRQSHVKTVLAFNLIDEYWLSYRETDQEVIEAEGVAAYIVWNDRIWRSIQAGYIKSLDIDFFFSLKSPVSRRLYRFLDKRMQYQDSYEIDIFDLAGRLGMTRYSYPSKVIEKLRPGVEELTERGYLRDAQTVKRGKYTRMSFVKQPDALSSTPIHAAPEETTRSIAESPHKEPTQPMLELLKAAGLGSRVAKRLARDHDAAYIQQKLDYLAFALENKSQPIRNPRGWLRRAIEEDYGPPDGYRSAEERAAEEAEQEERAQKQRDLLHYRRASVPNWSEWVTAEHEIPDDLIELTEELREVLSHQVTKAVYGTYMKRFQILEQEGREVTIAIPTQQAYEWLDYRFKPKFENGLEHLTGQSVSVIFTVLEQLEEAPNTSAASV